MEAYIKKYIITGAPGTGKTTLINALEKEYPCMHEVSRKVIICEQERVGKGVPWGDLDRFAALVYEASLRALDLSPNAYFTDRSILDLIAYLEVEGKPIPSQLVQFPYKEKFREQVFFAPTWEDIYHKDEQRLQEFDYCVELEKALIDIYAHKGFEVLQLPKVGSSKRSAFVQERIKNYPYD